MVSMRAMRMFSRMCFVLGERVGMVGGSMCGCGGCWGNGDA